MLDPINVFFVQSTRHVRHCKSFEGHQRGVSFIAWNPNGVYVIVCGPDETPEAIVWNTEVGWQTENSCHWVHAL